MTAPIHVVTAANGAYVPHVAAMLHSLFTSGTPGPFVAHFLHRPDFLAADLERLAALCTRHGACFEPASVDRGRLEGLPIGGWYVEEAWYRVFLPSLLPGVDRVLWLDADTIVMRPLLELWQIDLRDLPLAAVPNAVLHEAADGVARLGITDRSLYFNTGVLLLDLARMRAEDSEQALRAVVREHRDELPFADQDVLNCVYHRRYVRLPLAWNVLTHSFINVPETVRVHGSEEFAEALRAPRILHFTGRTAKKPWAYGASHPYRGAYLTHRAAAGWPPPDYPDRALRGLALRHVPLRLRAILSALRGGRFGELLSYLRSW